MKNKSMPTMVHAGVYASLLHYFKALEALGGNPHDGIKVVDKMKGRCRPTTSCSQGFDPAERPARYSSRVTCSR